jgi:hypothetical protein
MEIDVGNRCDGSLSKLVKLAEWVDWHFFLIDFEWAMNIFSLLGELWSSGAAETCAILWVSVGSELKILDDFEFRGFNFKLTMNI